MRTSLKGFLAAFLFLCGWQNPARAAQEVYLSHSPNGKYRVVIQQVLDRRVGDKFFFRYPLLLVNAKNLKHHFEMTDGAGPLVKETESGTFQVNWPSIRFEWSKDSLKLFVQMEVIDGIWKTFFVNLNTGKTTDITEDIEKDLVDKISSRGWDCQQPKFEIVKWVKPNLAFLKLTVICGKNRKEENNKLFYMTDSVLFDTVKVQAVSHCLDCKNDDSTTQKFEKYYISTIPTPTPTPEETPTTQ